MLHEQVGAGGLEQGAIPSPDYGALAGKQDIHVMRHSPKSQKPSPLMSGSKKGHSQSAKYKAQYGKRGKFPGQKYRSCGSLWGGQPTRIHLSRQAGNDGAVRWLVETVRVFLL